MRSLIAALLLGSVATVAIHAQHQHADMAGQHHDTVMKHGEQGMGFSQTATTHHFFVSDNGGIIQVEANDPKDKDSRDKIRMHLSHIAKAFQSGDFDIPMFVHDTKTVPGVADMQRLKDAINYKFEETKTGGKVKIESSNPEAIAAVHQFLRFQIEEHRTGDPKE
jgi:hypothetical protein